MFFFSISVQELFKPFHCYAVKNVTTISRSESLKDTESGTACYNGVRSYHTIHCRMGVILPCLFSLLVLHRNKRTFILINHRLAY
jgi:hypothetical protein